MNNFSKLLNASDEQIKQARVLNVVRTTSSISKQRVESKLTELRELENQIESLMDLCPDSSVDLNSNLKKFNPSDFVDNLYDYAIELFELYQKVIVGINIHNALFPEDKIEGLSTYDREFVSNIVGDVSICSNKEQ